MTRRDTITALQNTQQIKKIFFMEIIKNNITWKATWGILTQQKSSHPTSQGKAKSVITNLNYNFYSWELIMLLKDSP